MSFHPDMNESLKATGLETVRLTYNSTDFYSGTMAPFDFVIIRSTEVMHLR